MGKLNIKPRTIFCRDNLDILQGINSECIDLIYLDPPFNTGKEFIHSVGNAAEGGGFKDIFKEDDIKDDWVISIERENHKLYTLLTGIKEYGGKYNYCYCVFMAIRLLEMYRILKPTGSIYYHCDQTMSHYVKLVMDCIFGEKFFRNEIIWKKTNSTKSQSKTFGNQNDSIFFYSKTNNFVFNKVYMEHTEKSKKPFSFRDERGIYQTVALSNKTGLGGFGKMKEWEWRGVKKRWIYSKEKLDIWWREGRIYTTKTGNYRKKEYLEDSKGRLVSNLFIDEEVMPMQGGALERKGFTTQKPRKLLERIIKASSNKGDMVLDPFCGCATTCVAAEMLERNWAGIDVGEGAYSLVKMRLEEEIPEDMFRGQPNFTTTTPKRGEDMNRETAFVYIMQNDLIKDALKVGVSKDPESRAKSVMAQAPTPTRVIWKQKTIYYREIERFIHNEYLRKKEWVEASVDEIKSKIKDWKPEQQDLI